MADKKGFTIEVSSRYDGFWRYNIALMCGCFDAAGNRTEFVSAESHVADAGANLATKPGDLPDNRRCVLTTPPCDHLLLYIYIIPHTLPGSAQIDSTRPFEIELKIAYAGKKLRTEKRAINQWSGTSIEMRIGPK